MAPKQPCAKYQYVVTSSGPKILPVDEPSCKDEESPAEYNAGGYLPVKVGDYFNNNRYRVVRKLGWGHFSTVWLVKDSQTARHSALKVVKSAGRYAETARDEIKLLSRVSAFSPSHPGRQHIVSFLDSFSHQGPEASHVCIVFEPLGENLLALIERNKKKGVPRALVKVIARQILLGLEYLHDECDLVHTDIKPENILISIPDIEAHIHNELSQSPSPTSRRVGIPLPVKSRAGVSIPYSQQRTRRQVQIFDSQPLASPGRSGSANGHASLSMNARLDNTSGSVSLNGSYIAQIHMSRNGSGHPGHSSSPAINFSSSAPKIPSGLSASAPRNEASLKEKTAQIYAAKGITAVPSRVINSPSTSSSSSSISSALGSTTAGSSSLVSTPPTSLSHSLGNAVMEFVGTGTFETELRTRPRVSSHDKKGSGDEKEGFVIDSKKLTEKTNLETQISSAISSSWKPTDSWKDQASSSVQSSKSTSSFSQINKQRSVGHTHTRSHSGISSASFWKDLGTAAPAPAILVSAVVAADGRQDDFSKQSTVESADTTSGKSSTTATTVRPSPIGTPLPITKKSVSLASSVTKLISDTSNLLLSGTPPKDFTIRNDLSSHHPLSLLTQSAPYRQSPTTSPSKRSTTRVSPPQQISQLSAHMHLHKPNSQCNCSDPSHQHSRTSSGIRTNTKSRSSRLSEHPPISSVVPLSVPSTSTSVTPTPASPPPIAPPPTPVDSPSISNFIPSPTGTHDIPEGTSQHRTLPPLQTPADAPLPPPISIKIADLGNATPSKKHFTEDIQTRQYRAPEAILGRRDWDARADIWSVACVIFELLTAEFLFDPQGQGELFTKDDDHMAQIIELLGDFPLEVKMGGKYSRELFDHTGALRYIRTLKHWPLKRVMIEKYLFSEADATILCDFLEPMLAVDMRERKSAREMKNHKWLEPTLEDGIVTEW
ncbi:Serine/threonine-protein kinase SKY1 [Psilocybe cubensis]|uniref:Serine/threonine-protein kinase SKY1 n=2 Tax=Psilocybe cubensis TaxID=181762 RepID=A0ACB8HH95_PSICU|nr:Serine/threonine-protein kinase SKY1 [Psilocybe cubensis]KAH9487080.1 Serine/threonine-protein kinase SKY1 [Psilocybe cubensis]